MTAEAAVVARLQQIAAVTAIVGTRIYMLILPQSPVLPAIRVQSIDELTDYHNRGETRIGPARVQVDCWAAVSSGGDPFTAARTLGEAVNGNPAGSGLSAWRGTLGSPPFEVTLIRRVDFSVEFVSDEHREVRVRQDYQVHFRQ